MDVVLAYFVPWLFLVNYFQAFFFFKFPTDIIAHDLPWKKDLGNLDHPVFYIIVQISCF